MASLASQDPQDDLVAGVVTPCLSHISHHWVWLRLIFDVVGIQLPCGLERNMFPYLAHGK